MNTRWSLISVSVVMFMLLSAVPDQVSKGRSLEGDFLTLVTTIDTGGSPGAIVLDCSGIDCDRRHDVIFYDSDSSKIRFIDAETLTLSPEEVTGWFGFLNWMIYDRYHRQVYILGDKSKCDDWGNNCWREIRVHIIAGRSRTSSFVINEAYKDFRYAVDGLTLKQPHSEDNEPARIFIDDTVHGNIDVIDLASIGTDQIQLQRYSYRDPLACADQQTCHWQINEGNSLALETKHETLAEDDLSTNDILYIADDNGNPFHIRAIRINHPLQNLNPVPLPDIDFSTVFPCNFGVRGLSMAGPRDILYMPSGCQSFELGAIAEFGTTTNQSSNVVSLTYRDQNFMHVDWYDSRRVFVATSDAFCGGEGAYDPSCGLYLHLIYDGTVVDSLLLMTGYPGHSLEDMVFDPYSRRLYLTVGSSVMVVQVDYGASAATVAPIVGLQVITPAEGGSLIAPDHSAELYFFPGTVSVPVEVTYRETDSSASSISNISTGSASAEDLFTLRTFDISAVISGTTTLVNSFDSSYQVKINYTDKERGSAIENKLGLYRWDGGEWQLETTSSVSEFTQIVTASPTQTGLFAVMGETNRIYLPIVVQ